MAFVDLVPQSLNVAITQGFAQSFSSAAVLSPTGSPIDLSAWVSLTAKLVPPSPNPTGTDTTFGTVTATNAGIVKLKLAATDLATIATGSAKLLITGKPTALDDAQVLSTGVASILNS